MWWKHFFLIMLFSQEGRSEFVKYYDERGYPASLWNIFDFPARSCRAENGYHQCVSILGGENICVVRSEAPMYCVGAPRLNCTNNEIEMLDQFTHQYKCIPRFEIQNYEEFENIYLPCHPTEFECEVTKKCIPRYFVQDGFKDCGVTDFERGKILDYSDEKNFLPNCFEKTEFSCSGVGRSRCIPRTWVRNSVTNCQNATDENASLNCNNRTEYECTGTRRCILRRHVNDNFKDCPSNDDELIRNFTCIDQLEFSCDKVNGIGRCLPKEWVGNGIKECKNGEDERVTLLEFVVGEVECLDNSQCLPSKYICDGNQNCKDGSDEVELCNSPSMYRYKPQRLIPWSFLHFESNSTIYKRFPDFSSQNELAFGLKCHVIRVIDVRNKASTQQRHIPQFYVLNNISVCANNEDVCFDSNSTFTCARCLDGTIISKPQVCDDVIDCRDLSSMRKIKSSRIM